MMTAFDDPFAVALPVPQYNAPNNGEVGPLAAGFSVDSGGFFRVAIPSPADIELTYSGLCPNPLETRPDLTVEGPNGTYETVWGTPELDVWATVGSDPHRYRQAWKQDSTGTWVTIFQVTHSGGAVSLGRDGYLDACANNEGPARAMSGNQTAT